MEFQTSVDEVGDSLCTEASFAKCVDSPRLTLITVSRRPSEVE